MRWENILEAFFEFPALILENIVEAMKNIFTVERDVLTKGDFEEENQD